MGKIAKRSTCIAPIRRSDFSEHRSPRENDAGDFNGKKATRSCYFTDRGREI